MLGFKLGPEEESGLEQDLGEKLNDDENMKYNLCLFQAHNCSQFMPFTAHFFEGGTRLLSINVVGGFLGRIIRYNTDMIEY